VDLNRKIRDFEAGFRELYLDAIPLLHHETPTGKGSGHYLSFSTIFSGIECLASMFSGKQPVKNNTGDRFKKFVPLYFGSPTYATHVDDLWLLRCSLAHSFSPGGKFTLTTGNPRHHFLAATDGRICLNAETFLQDFVKAADRYFQDLRGRKGVQQKFELSVRQTGTTHRNVELPTLPGSEMKLNKVWVQTSQNAGTNVSHISRAF
jgi:hypothetical protein